jgi:PAS domain S-box-containing protein
MPNPIRVLILEDRADDADLMLHELRQAGFDPIWQLVEIEPDYLKALEANFELILADWSLPQFSGLRALQLLKERGLDIPFIIVSGIIGEEAAVEAMQQGAADYLLKDRLTRLAQAVRRALENKQLRDERKRAKEKQMESKALIDAVVENIPLMIFLKEATDLRFVLFNRAGEELLGYDRKTLLGKNDLDLFPLEQAAHFMAKDREVLDGEAGMLDILEEPILMAKKGKRLLHTRKVRIRGTDGTTNYLLGISEDITERKLAEKQLKAYSEHLAEMVAERTRALTDAQEKLIHQEKLAVLGQIAGSVSHELRNPLGTISNAVYFLKLVQPDADEKIKQYHNMIESETHNAEKIISDLLDFTRLKSIERESVSVVELVQRTLIRYPVPKTITVTLKLPPDLPAVVADPRQMEQVLGNLTVNACQAMASQTSSATGVSDGGKLTISSRRKKGMVAITIKDSGVGIPPENMPKLFDPLFTTKAKGIGLGLPISKKLAEANGGRIEVQSEPGKGSTFTVYLPAQDG